ncbi:uncharacterized protein LOC128987061 isoform X4 [Macrosteles quadrilineatus]|uniref:uncharacterized protein LOC128987061 isoform X4 n=1 Tax=Macrosteles quadrilineatus TaxID=74068 RepID=UPI0023E3202F|nr:uncharacterized protein LOC128987061 isoform X4 [Macrosteles quadrilineatus]
MENTEESQLASYESCKLLALSTYQSASERCENQNILTTIKRKYEGVINSPRTFEYINDLHTLLKVLEKRCELQPTDIHVLEYIYSVLNIKTHNLDYHKTILHDTGKSTHNVHSRGDVPLQATNSNTVPTFHYSNPRQSSSGVIGNGSLDQQRLNKRGDVPLQDTNSNTVPTFHYSPPRQSSSGVIGNGSLDQQRLNTRVVTEISSRIGSSWQDFARYLKVQECIIHEISQDPRFADEKAKAKAMLQEYENQALPEELKVNLMKALKLTRRMDIHDIVQKLFLREI